MDSKVEEPTRSRLPMQITHIHPDMAVIGARAADELLSEIAGSERAGRMIHVEAELRVGGSTVGS